MWREGVLQRNPPRGGGIRCVAGRIGRNGRPRCAPGAVRALTGKYIGDKNHCVKEKSEKTGNFYWTSFERPRTRIPHCRPGRPAGESRGPVPAGTASAWGSGPRIAPALRPGKQSKFDGAGRTRLTRLFPEREKYKNRADPIREAPPLPPRPTAGRAGDQCRAARTRSGAAREGWGGKEIGLRPGPPRAGLGRMDGCRNSVR